MKEILELIKEKKVILFGETHGTEEIPIYLEDLFINKLKETNFAAVFEIPKQYKNNINDFFINEGGKHGLATKPYQSLVRKLTFKGIKIFLIDGYSKTQKDKEKKLAEEILKLEDSKKFDRLIVIMGDFHASRFPIKVNGKNIETVGFILKKILKKKFASVRITSDNAINSHFNGSFDGVILLKIELINNIYNTIHLF